MARPRGSFSVAGPIVRIHLPPAASQRTFGSSRTHRIRLGQNANNRARYKRSENQVHRTRVREVRIQFPPAESPQTIGSAGDFTGSFSALTARFRDFPGEPAG